MSKKLIQILGFKPKENASDIFIKKYVGNYAIEVNFENEIFNYGKKIKVENKITQNFSQTESWVVLECVDRLLEKGYKPENIVLEKTWPAGHETSGRLDVCVTRNDGSEYLLIDCKTYGKEFEKSSSRLHKDGGQLFTYFKFSNKADIIMLYASELKGNAVVYKNEIIKIETDYRVGDAKDFYEKWNKLTKDNGVFEAWVKPYNYESKALTCKQLKPIQQEDSGFIFNRFLEILRHNVVSDKPNAFNKIFTLFLCKVYDEKTTKENEELKFQWLEGKDDNISFQLRLTDLYKAGMKEFLDKEVTDFSDEQFENEYASLFIGNDELKRKFKENVIYKLRLEKNNEFAIKEVYDEKSFTENAKIVKEVVELLQGFRIRYNKRQQYLSDFFELLLTTGLKQESGQFFTPVPVAQFIIKSLPIDTLVNEKIEKGERNNLLPYIIDYAAGSGHFLTESMHEIQHIIDEKKASNFIDETKKKLKAWQEDNFDWATQYVYGIEKDYRLVKVGKVGCYLHGDGLANVILSDGLANFRNTKEYKDLLKKTDANFPKENKQFDIVISNPPYSVSAFKTPARSYYTEKDFDLYDDLTDNSSEIECLFIERTKQLLKDGGMAGIILPSSILRNTGIYTKAREIILQYFEIIAITELGSNTFMATGTNTVVLFLRRRNNYASINLKKAMEKFFTDHKDITLNGVEKPASKYVAHVWENISFNDYVTLLKKEPNKAIEQQEIYKEYRKKIKAKNEADFWKHALRREAEKLLYFILACPQKVVLIKSGQKDDEKRFLGYEFSNRRGSEGIHPLQRGKSIAECTKFFDEESFENPEKASTYVYRAFKGDFESEIHVNLQQNITRHALVDMLTFDRVEFEKNISLILKKKVKIESKWEIKKLNEVSQIDWGNTNLTKTIYKENGQFDVYSATGLDGKADFFENDGNAIILSAIGARCGKCFYAKGKWTAIKNTIIIKPQKNILLKYLFEYVNNESYWTKSGTAQPFITLGSANEQKIPLPPLGIQKKIVSEIEILETNEKNTKFKKEEFSNELHNIINELNQYKTVALEKISQNLDHKRKPVTKGYRNKGQIPYYGASGIIDYVSHYILDDEVLLVAEDGANLKSRTTPIAFSAKGKMWVNNHVHILKFENKNIHKIVEIYLNKTDLSKFITGQAQPKLNQQNLHSIKVPLPPVEEQQKFISKIESIENKISVLNEEISVIPKQKEEILKKYL
jgi:type I restriction enzyme M protein